MSSIHSDVFILEKLCEFRNSKIASNRKFLVAFLTRRKRLVENTKKSSISQKLYLPMLFASIHKNKTTVVLRVSKKRFKLNTLVCISIELSLFNNFTKQRMTNNKINKLV